MNLTKTERIILYRLHEILAQVRPSDAEDHRRDMSILLNGYHERHYKDEAFAEPIEEADAAFVTNVLAMFDNLQFSYRKLAPEQRAEIDEQELQFLGFDGNHECELMGYARCRVEELGHWQSLKRNPSFNSHSPMRGAYQRMLDAAPDITWTPEHGYSADQIKAVLATRRHPRAREAAE